VRFVKVDDYLNYTTETNLGNMIYQVSSNNNMTGGQVGGDVWICLLPGLRLGAEAKAGIYGNLSSAGTIVRTNNFPNPGIINEDTQNNRASFVGELNLQMTYRLNYNWTLKAGYDFLWISGIALAPDNFNTTRFDQPRTPFVDSTGDIAMHGFNVGLEFLW
jgi:hypothetical protein